MSFVTDILSILVSLVQYGVELSTANPLTMAVLLGAIVIYRALKGDTTIAAFTLIAIVVLFALGMM